MNRIESVWRREDRQVLPASNQFSGLFPQRRDALIFDRCYLRHFDFSPNTNYYFQKNTLPNKLSLPIITFIHQLPYYSTLPWPYHPGDKGKEKLIS